MLVNCYIMTTRWYMEVIGGVPNDVRGCAVVPIEKLSPRLQQKCKISDDAFEVLAEPHPVKEPPVILSPESSGLFINGWTRTEPSYIYSINQKRYPNLLKLFE